MLEELIDTVERHCGETDTYSVYLKEEVFNEVRRRIVEKLRDRREVKKVFVKGVYGKYEVSVFNNGRLVVSGVKNEEELVNVLSQLLTPS